MNDIKKIIKGTGIYLIGTVFTKLIQFLLLPLYTTYLSPSEYGAYDLNLAYATFLWTVIYLDIYSGVLRFMFDYKGKEKYKAVNNGLLIFLLSTGIYACALTILFFSLKNIIGYPVLLFLVGTLTVLQQVIGYVARGLDKNKLFVIGGIIGAFTTFGATYIALVYLGKGYASLYWTTILGIAMNILFMVFTLRLWRYIRFSFFERKLFIELLRFSLPLSINSVSYWFLTGFNRIIISMFLSVEENGLYAVVAKFGAIVNLFTQAFQMAWQEMSFSKADEKKEKLSEFYSAATNKFMLFLLCGILISLPVLKIIFPLMIDQRYAASISLLPLTLLSAVFSAYSSFLASIISTFKNTKVIFTTTFTGALVNLFVILIFIRLIGVQAAVISLTVGFFITFLRRVQCVNKEIPLIIHWRIFFITLFLFMISSLFFIYANLLLNIGTFLCSILFTYCVFREDINKFKK